MAKCFDQIKPSSVQPLVQKSVHIKML
jgi:hypothetical protein